MAYIDWLVRIIPIRAKMFNVRITLVSGLKIYKMIAYYYIIWTNVFAYPEDKEECEIYKLADTIFKGNRICLGHELQLTQFSRGCC